MGGVPSPGELLHSAVGEVEGWADDAAGAVSDGFNYVKDGAEYLAEETQDLAEDIAEQAEEYANQVGDIAKGALGLGSKISNASELPNLAPPQPVDFDNNAGPPSVAAHIAACKKMGGKFVPFDPIANKPMSCDLSAKNDASESFANDTRSAFMKGPYLGKTFVHGGVAYETSPLDVGITAEHATANKKTAAYYNAVQEAASLSSRPISSATSATLRTLKKIKGNRDAGGRCVHQSGPKDLGDCTKMETQRTCEAFDNDKDIECRWESECQVISGDGHYGKANRSQGGGVCWGDSAVSAKDAAIQDCDVHGGQFLDDEHWTCHFPSTLPENMIKELCKDSGMAINECTAKYSRAVQTELLPERQQEIEQLDKLNEFYKDVQTQVQAAQKRAVSYQSTKPPNKRFIWSTRCGPEGPGPQGKCRPFSNWDGMSKGTSTNAWMSKKDAMAACETDPGCKAIITENEDNWRLSNKHSRDILNNCAGHYNALDENGIKFGDRGCWPPMKAYDKIQKTKVEDYDVAAIKKGFRDSLDIQDSGQVTTKAVKFLQPGAREKGKLPTRRF